MKARVLPMVALLAVACPGRRGSTPHDRAVPDTLTTRRRDSVLGASPIPGASGVRGALRIADSAAARNARIDSLAGS